ncbi:hypothetical protein PO909_000189 [Leuciscus waleckii]
MECTQLSCYFSVVFDLRPARATPSNPWLSEVLREHRTELRAAERKWRKSKDTSDLTYTPYIRKNKPTIRTINTWPVDALSQLQDCFSTTEWSLFESLDVEEYTESVLSYITFCTVNVTVTKRIRVFPNEKPWMTSEVRHLIRDRNTAFRSGDRAQYSSARANLRKGIRDAKVAYKRKIEGHIMDNNPRQVWQGLQYISNYKGHNITSNNPDAKMAEELNSFFARFEVNGQSAPPPAFTSTSLSLQEHQVRRALREVNPRKAAGPDGVPGKVLRACADQLTGILTKIFNISLTRAIVPSCWKSTTIIPVPKTSARKSLNDFRPIALTSLVMKCLERLVAQHIKACLPPSFDPHQFAYRANRSTEDAIAITLHATLSHLEHSGSYARLLFIDFSSAFNTIIPDILIKKLLGLHLPPSTCAWIKTFSPTDYNK